MTINLLNKIQQVAFNRELVGTLFELAITYEQNLDEVTYTSALDVVYINSRWSVMAVDFTAFDLFDGQAHYRLLVDGVEILNGRMNIKLN